MNAAVDYYAVLGVSEDASLEEIRSAYRSLAQKVHPDKDQSPEAVARFQQLNEAYQVLADQAKRARYDDLGEAEVSEANELRANAVAALSVSMQSLLDLGGNIDFISAMRHQAVSIRQNNYGCIEQCRMKIRHYEQETKRWRNKKGGRNVFANLLRRQIRRLKGEIKAAEETIELSEECLRVLDEYEYGSEETFLSMRALLR